MKKIQYLKPITEALVVRFEGNIMSNPGGYHNGGGGSYTPGDGGDVNENGDY